MGVRGILVGLRLSTGEKLSIRRLVNTMPLTAFIRLCAGLPREVKEAASRLRATTVYYFDLGVRGSGDAASDYHWIYFPEPEFIFYRVGSYSAVHKPAAPAGCRSYYVEMSGDRAGLLNQPEALKTRVLSDLRRSRVISEHDEILFMELCQIPQAYVVFDQDYEAARKVLLDYLAERDIQSIGRWGGWNYGGMEDAMLDGKRAADAIKA